MKIMIWAMSAICGILSFRVFAGNLVYDGFEDYAAGTKLGNGSPNGGTGFAGGFIGQVGTSPDASYVMDGGLVYQGGTLKVDGGNRRLRCTKLTNYDNPFRRKTQTYGSDVFYFSFMVRTDTQTVAGSDQDDMAVGFYSKDAYPPCGVAIGGSGTKYFRARVLNTDGQLSSIQFEGDTTYFVVCKVEKTQKSVKDRYNKVSILVNPTSDVEPATWDIEYEYTGTGNTGFDNAELNFINFGVKRANQEDGDWYDLDELRAGTVWNDVVVNASAPADAVWTGEGNTDGWNETDNWADGAAPAGADVSFGLADLTTQDVVNNVVSSSVTVKSLSYTNSVASGTSAAWHVTEIGQGVTLLVTGANDTGHALELTGVSGFSDAKRTVYAKMTGGGDFRITGGGDVNLQLNGSEKRGDAWFDASGLNSLDFDIGSMTMGMGVSTLGKFWCAASGTASNVVRATYLGVGDSRGGKQYPATSEFRLGKSNWIFADAISVGATIPGYGNWASGILSFADGVESPSLVVRGRDGTGRASRIMIGCHGDTDTFWYNVSGVFDTSAGSVDMLADAMVLGDGRGYWDPSNQRGECNGTFRMSDGSADVNSLVLGRSIYTGGGKQPRSYPGYGRLEVSGGTFSVNGETQVANNNSKAYQCAKGEIVLSGGDFVAHGPVVLATRSGYATSVVARVQISGGALTALGGLHTGEVALNEDYALVELVADVSVAPGAVLAVTNESHDAELRLDHGALQLGGGMVFADSLVMTNSLSTVVLSASENWNGGVVVSGAVKLGGTFRATLPEGMTRAPAGRSWKIAEGASRIGTFEVLDVPDRCSVRYTSKGAYFGNFNTGLTLVVR